MDTTPSLWHLTPTPRRTSRRASEPKPPAAAIRTIDEFLSASTVTPAEAVLLELERIRALLAASRLDEALEATWRPENYSGKFYGPTRLREALYRSRNLVSIRVLRTIGPPYAAR